MPATTSPWGLPYPVATDPPNGAAQLQSLATTADTQLLAIRKKSNPPWVMITTTAMTIPTNTGQYMGLSIFTQHASNYFTLANANNLVCTASGLFEGMACIRTRNTTTTGIGGYVQAYFEVPGGGAAVYDTLSPTYGGSWVDLISHFTFRWTNPDSLAIRAYNNSGQDQQFTSSKIFFVRVGD